MTTSLERRPATASKHPAGGARGASAPTRWLRVATALGELALAWTGREVVGLLLPSDDLAERAADCWPGAAEACADAGSGVPPAWIAALAGRLRAHLATPSAGDPFLDIRLDLGGRTPFQREVLAAARSIPPGKVVTYGALAGVLGRPGAARAVGAALARNPIPLLVPCHRIVGSDGGLRGFSAPGGLATKRALLDLEGAAAEA